MYSSDVEKTKNQTQRTRSTEKREVSSQINSTGEKGIGDNGGNNGGIDRGTIGEIRSRGNSDILCAITRGIITQLIEDAESQLGETRDCIKWYEEKEKEQLKRIESLQHLKELREHLPTED